MRKAIMPALEMDDDLTGMVKEALRGDWSVMGPMNDLIAERYSDRDDLPLLVGRLAMAMEASESYKSDRLRASAAPKLLKFLVDNNADPDTMQLLFGRADHLPYDPTWLVFRNVEVTEHFYVRAALKMKRK